MSDDRKFLIRRIVELGLLTERQARHQSTKELERYYLDYKTNLRVQREISEGIQEPSDFLKDSIPLIRTCEECNGEIIRAPPRRFELHGGHFCCSKCGLLYSSTLEDDIVFY